ncbi:MAG: cytochrome c [Woeseiaceae bacterium]|nr:cytochrome c [Woeseiaceae bacterium]
MQAAPRLPLIALLVLVVAGCSGPATDEGAANPSAAGVDPATARGQNLYFANCVACHLPAGTGLEGAFPPLAGSDFLEGGPERVIATVLYGNEGPITVNGVQYNGVMPGFAHLTDEEVAAVVTYILGSWGNDYPAVQPADVAGVRAPAQ